MDAENKKIELVLFSIGLLLVNTLLAIWSCYDHALPVYDMACHLLSGFACADLLAHAHPAHGYWWRSLLAVNPLYPPFVYLMYGVFKLAFGPARWVELLVQHLFSTILFASLYGLGKLIFSSRSIALLSALLIFAFPIVFDLTHYDMLDIPGLAMISLALLCFTWWQQKPSYLSSISLGVACALTALTKNNCVAFLIAPFAVILIQSLFKHDWQRCRVFLLVALTSLVVMLPWLIFAAPAMFKTIATYQNTNYHASYIDHVKYYIFQLPSLTSYFLFAIFLLAVCTARKSVHRQMLFLTSSAIGGILILCCFHWPESTRYELPATIPMALYCAWMGVICWQKSKTRLLSVAAALLTCLAFIQNNFTSYPLPRLPLPTALATLLSIKPARTNPHHAPGGASTYPTPPADWGCDWALDTIRFDCTKSDLSKSFSNIKQFAIMPDSEEVSSTTYSYLIKRANLPLHAFTPRTFTLLGEELSFEPDIAKTIDWYLLTKGSTESSASHFCNKESAKAYIQWCDFVRTSKLFKLIGSKPLPDGGALELYKNISK